MFRFFNKRSSGRKAKSGTTTTTTTTTKTKKMMMTANSYSPASASDVIDREINEVQVVPMQVEEQKLKIVNRLHPFVRYN